MKKNQLIKGLLFIFIFLLLLQSVTYIVRTNGNVKDRFVGFYAEGRNTLDAVMIGSSPVYPCFSGPQLWGEYGITSYPLSSNRQRPQAALGLVQEALKTQSPQLLLFEVKQFAADETGEDNEAYTRGVTDNMKYSWNRIRTINAMVEDASKRYTYYFDIFKYHSNWKTMLLPSQLVCFRYEYPHPQKGFVLKDGIRPASYVDYSGVTEKLPITQVNEKSLYELLDYLKENKMQALFLLAPYELENKEKKMNFNYIEDIVTSYGYDYMDFNEYLEEMDFDFEKDFYDGGVHTNAIGAEKCTRLLGDYMTEHYDFNRERDGDHYVSWNQAYELWNEDMGKARVTIQNAIKSKTYTSLEEEEE